MVPTIIGGRFEVLGLAGSGGMGRVYRARDRETGEGAAVKVLLPNSIFRARFERESAILAELRHPGIVRHIAHGTTAEDELYLAMEWLDGEELAQRLKRQELSIAETVALGIRVAGALGEAHRHGIIHRDVKPGNLLLVAGAADRVKLLDFGIARSTQLGKTLTTAGEMLGTPGYLAPEQARGEPAIDARADVFALGCVLYRCLTGRRAFLGEDLPSILLRVVLEDPPRVRELRPEVPPLLDELVTSMLSKVKGGRPATGAVVAAGLAEVPLRPSSETTAPWSPRAAVTATEQRLLCVLVARAVGGGSDTSTRLDAADEASKQALTAAVERYDGKLSVLADGSLSVTVGTAGTPADQAVRAARCGLAMRPFLPGVAMVLVAGRTVLSGPIPVGTAIDRAVAVVRRSSDVGIHVDAVVAGLLDERFDVRPDLEGGLLLGERDPAEASYNLLSAPRPYVGREAELDRLVSSLDECSSERVAHAVLVTAPAGAGKSRLRHELLRRLRGRAGGADPGCPAIWEGSADPMCVGSPFATLGAALRSAFDVHPGEPLALRQQKILSRSAARFPGPAGVRMAALLGRVMRTRLFAEDEHVPSSQIELGEDIRQAVLDWLRAEAAERTVLIVLDNLQWGDRPSISLLDSALRDLADLPILVLGLARPEIASSFPELWADRALVEIKLGPLSRRAGARLVREALGAEATDAVVEKIVSRGLGNALYLEELIRAVAEGHGDELPMTVLAMAETRLEQLGPELRRVLRAASLFGDVFWKGGVHALLTGADPDLDGQIEQLAAREIIVRRAVPRFAGEEEYSFRHGLVREAAYAMLADGDRARGHATAGDWLERGGEPDAILLAEHFERGEEPARAAGWYQRAAEQAFVGFDPDGTVAHAERAIGCGAGGERLGDLRMLVGEAHWWNNEPLRARAQWAEALTVFAHGSYPWWRATGAMLMIHVQLCDAAAFAALAVQIEELEPSLSAQASPMQRLGLLVPYLCLGGRCDLALKMMERLERGASSFDALDLSELCLARCSVAMYTNASPWARLDEVMKALRVFEQTRDARRVIRVTLFHALALHGMGAYGEAERILREAICAADKVHTPFFADEAEQHLTAVLLETGRLEEARALARKVLTAQGKTHNLRVAARVRLTLAKVHLHAGDLEGALLEAEAGLRDLTAPQSRAEALAVLASVRLARGEGHLALPLTEEASALLESLGTLPDGAALIRFNHAQALAAASRSEDARKAHAAARAHLLTIAATIEDAELRRTYLEGVPLHRRILAGSAVAVEG